jgi:phage-related protein
LRKNTSLSCFSKQTTAVSLFEIGFKIWSGDKKIVGTDIKTVEFGWPVGMPTCRPLGDGIWEVRSNLSGGRIARILFCITDGFMILLHSFIKKSQKTPKPDLEIAKMRKRRISEVS